MTVRIFLTLLLVILLPVPSEAQESTSASDYKIRKKDFDPSQYSEVIEKAEDYLSKFDTLETRFTQLLPGVGGSISNGKLYISRPGKARWEYLSPNEAVLIIKKGRLTYYDKGLDQVSYAKLPPTAINVLLDKNVKLSGEVKVVDVIDSHSTITIIVAPNPASEVNRGKEISEFESISLVFSKNPFELIRLQRTDENNNATTLSLINTKLNKKLDDELFVFKNPKTLKRKKN